MQFAFLYYTIFVAIGLADILTSIRPDLFAVTRVCFFEYTRPIGKKNFYQFEMKKVAWIFIYNKFGTKRNFCQEWTSKKFFHPHVSCRPGRVTANQHICKSGPAYIYCYYKHECVDYTFLSTRFRLNPRCLVAWISRTTCSKQVPCLKFKWSQCALHKTTVNAWFFSTSFSRIHGFLIQWIPKNYF